MYRVGTAQLTNDIGMGLLDMAWQISIIKIHECAGTRPLEKLNDAITKANTMLQSRARVGDGNVTVHVWLSMQFVMGTRHPFVILTSADFAENLARELYCLDMEASRPIFVSLCPQSAFNCVEGRIERLVKEVEMKLKDKGIFVSTSSQMWRGMYSVGGHQFRIAKKAVDADLGKGAIWSVIERQLFRQRVFLMCASDRVRVDQLNERAHRAEDSGIDAERLKVVTCPPTLFDAFQGAEPTQRMSEETWKEIAGQQNRANSSRARRFQKKKTAWIEAEMAPTDLEPREDNNVYWFPVDIKQDGELMCTVCRANVGNEKFYKHKENARNCINCSANDQCQYGIDRDQGRFARVAHEISEQQALMMLVARIKHALAISGMTVQSIDVDFKDWLVQVVASFVANAGLSYGEKLMKAVSHMGGVRIPEHQVREIFKSNRGKQFLVIR